MDEADINLEAARRRAARAEADARRVAAAATEVEREARSRARHDEAQRARDARHAAEKTTALAAAHRFATWAKTNRVKAPCGGLIWRGWLIGVDERTTSSGSTWMHGDVIEHTSTTRTKCYVTTRGKLRLEASSRRREIRWHLVPARIEQLVIELIAAHPESLTWP